MRHQPVHSWREDMGSERFLCIREQLLLLLQPIHMLYYFLRNGQDRPQRSKQVISSRISDFMRDSLLHIASKADVVSGAEKKRWSLFIFATLAAIFRSSTSILDILPVMAQKSLRSILPVSANRETRGATCLIYSIGNESPNRFISFVAFPYCNQCTNNGVKRSQETRSLDEVHGRSTDGESTLLAEEVRLREWCESELTVMRIQW